MKPCFKSRLKSQARPKIFAAVRPHKILVYVVLLHGLIPESDHIPGLRVIDLHVLSSIHRPEDHIPVCSRALLPFERDLTALGLCSLLKVAGFRKRDGYGASVSELLFLFYHHVSMIQIKQFTVTIHPQRNLISVPQKEAYIDFFPTAIITGESLFCF